MDELAQEGGQGQGHGIQRVHQQSWLTLQKELAEVVAAGGDQGHGEFAQTFFFMQDSHNSKDLV